MSDPKNQPAKSSTTPKKKSFHELGQSSVEKAMSNIYPKKEEKPQEKAEK